jgi:hypothetical protein
VAVVALVACVGGCTTTQARVREPDPPAGTVIGSLEEARDNRIAAQIATLDPAVLDLSRRASAIAWSCWHTPGTIEEACSAIARLPRASSVSDIELQDEILECHRACTIRRTAFADARAADLANPQPHGPAEECKFHCYDGLGLGCGIASDRCAMVCEGRNPNGP